MNRELLKQKLDQMKRQAGGNKLIWKPKPGKQVVRIVPYAHNPDWPFIEMYFHYNIANKPLVSPHSYGRRDPIKEFAESIQASAKSKHEWKVGKNLEPKERTYVPILVRGEEEQGVRFWGFGSQIYRALLMKIDDPEWGDISHPVHGRDITVIFEKASGPNSFPKTTIDVKPNVTPVTEDRKIMDMIGQVEDISTMWEEPTVEELTDILEKYLNAGKSKSEPTGQSKQYGSTTNDSESNTESNPEAVTTTYEGGNDEAPSSDDADGLNTIKDPNDIMNAFNKYFPGA